MSVFFLNLFCGILTFCVTLLVWNNLFAVRQEAKKVAQETAEKIMKMTPQRVGGQSSAQDCYQFAMSVTDCDMKLAFLKEALRIIEEGKTNETEADLKRRVNRAICVIEKSYPIDLL